jgi:hypothetical protein
MSHIALGSDSAAPVAIRFSNSFSNTVRYHTYLTAKTGYHTFTSDDSTADLVTL